MVLRSDTYPLRTLIDRCIAGDALAWEQLVRRHAGLVYAVCRRHGLDPHGCDDVAQEVFARLAGALRDIRDPDSLPGWLATTARREAWRAKQRGGREAPTDATDSVVEQPAIDDLISHARLRDALEELGGRCRDLIHALYFRPITPSYEGLARELGVPIGSLGPTRQRCLAKLAAILDPSSQELTAQGQVSRAGQVSPTGSGPLEDR